MTSAAGGRSPSAGRSRRQISSRSTRTASRSTGTGRPAPGSPRSVSSAGRAASGPFAPSSVLVGPRSPKSRAGRFSWRGAARRGRASTAPRGAGGGAKRAPTQTERRNRVPIALAALVAAVVLGTSFPLASLLSQHRQQGAASAQLSRIRAENDALVREQKALSSPAAVNGLARQDYQLVQPGQTLYDVLPSTKRGSGGADGTIAATDPGQQAPVQPSKAPDMSPDPALVQPSAPQSSTSAGPARSARGGRTASASSSQPASAPSSFWSRIGNTLEFWK